MTARERKLRIALFGHFGQFNFGNDTTLQAIVHHLRRLDQNADIVCICSDPGAVAAAHGISAAPSRTLLAESWKPRSLPSRLARKLMVDIPGEFYQWFRSLRMMWGMQALLIPGTGLLTDADTWLSWGPYDLFRWSVSAKVCRCRLLFVSVGAGPLETRTGRFLVKAALSLADYRSYRDRSSVMCLEDIGFRTLSDPVYPDLAFSLPAEVIPAGGDCARPRPVVGLGLMKVPRKPSVQATDGASFSPYLESLAEFAGWLFSHQYGVRLLYGDIADESAMQEFKSVLRDSSSAYQAHWLIDEPIASVDDLLKQVAATDIVVATRYHNVLSALLLKKPVLAISYHHKCISLMSQMGLTEYCLPRDQLSSGGLIERFSRLQLSADPVIQTIEERVETCRHLLDEQYVTVFGTICSSR